MQAEGRKTSGQSIRRIFETEKPRPMDRPGTARAADIGPERAGYRRSRFAETVDVSHIAV